MASAKERFSIYDIVTATDITIQVAHNEGLTCPPTDELTVLGFNEECLILSDGSDCWHHSHFYKVGERADLKALMELECPPDPDMVNGVMPSLDFNEMGYVEEVANYILATYGQHYAKEGVQTFELICKRPLRGLHFALGNVMKYADRFGEKDGMNRKDLLKVAHYSLLALFAFDQLNEEAAA